MARRTIAGEGRVPLMVTRNESVPKIRQRSGFIVRKKKRVIYVKKLDKGRNRRWWMQGRKIY